MSRSRQIQNLVVLVGRGLAVPASSIIAISGVSGRQSDFACGPHGTAKTVISGYLSGLARLA